MDYAVRNSTKYQTYQTLTNSIQVGGAVTNKTLWPSKSTASDFIEQVGIFLSKIAQNPP
jgi:hypothetical protein